MAADYRPPITAGTQAAINAEASTRASADTALAGTVTAEAVARANADSAEATARANAITAAITGLALSSDLSAETTARIAADTTLTTAVGLKASSAALASETSSRASADTALDGRLSTVESNSAALAAGRLYVQASRPTQGALPWRWVKIDSDGVPTGYEEVYSPLLGTPANVIAPAVTGFAVANYTLTCSTGTWDHYPSSYAYQWKRAGAAISGATASTYVVQAADAGQAITCTVTATGDGSASATSAAVTAELTALVADSMTGPAGGTLDAHFAESGTVWTKVTGVTGAMALTDRGRLRAALAALAYAYVASDTPTTAEYDVEADFVILTVGQSDFPQIGGRMLAGADTGYYAAFTPFSLKWELLRIVAGVQTVLGTYVMTSAVTLGVPISIKLQIRDATKKVFINGVERISSADNTLTAKGQGGVRGYSSQGMTYLTGTHIDNFHVSGPAGVVADDFNGASGAALASRAGEIGATWAKTTGVTGNVVISSTNRARGSSAAVAWNYTASGVPATAEYDVEANFVYVSLQADFQQIGGRMLTSADTGYFVTTSGGDLLLTKIIAGSQTVLGTYTLPATAAGDAYHIKLQIRDAAKKLFVNGVERLSSADNAITAKGLGGIRGFSTLGQTDTTGTQLDHFRVRDA